MENQFPQPSTEFLFQDGQEMTQKELKAFYLKRFNDLVQLTETNKLILHNKKLPDSSICKNNTCFILARSLTSNADKIIRELEGARFGDENKRRINSFGKFLYIDAYCRGERTLGMRVVKLVAESQDSDFSDKYSKFYQYILVHFYLRADLSFPRFTRHTLRAKTLQSDDDDEDDFDIDSSDESDLDDSYKLPQSLRQKKAERKKKYFEIRNQQQKYFSDKNQEQKNFEQRNHQPKEETRSQQISKPPKQHEFQQPNQPIVDDKDQEVALLRKQLFETERQYRYLEIQLLDLQEEILQYRRPSSGNNQESNFQPFNNKVKFGY